VTYGIRKYFPIHGAKREIACLNMLSIVGFRIFVVITQNSDFGLLNASALTPNAHEDTTSIVNLEHN